jgi:hypothetical protein
MGRAKDLLGPQWGMSRMGRFLLLAVSASLLAACSSAPVGDSTGPSGDTGGKVLQQLEPVASALPGYGTSNLPWVSTPSISHPYVIKSEPRMDSCAGRPGTQGWSQVVVQAMFDWTGSGDALTTEVGDHLHALGWSSVPIRDSTDFEAMWSKRLPNESKANATLNLSATGPPHWEFVALAPPTGKAATGC